MRGLLAVLVLAVSLAACRHAEPTAGSTCADLQKGLDFSRPLDALNDLSDGFYRGCYDFVIADGPRARERFGNKTYSLSRETASVFVPDGKVIDYTLESHERGFLTVLIADSYLKKGKDEDARVELRRLDQELFTRQYNHGADPTNVALSAVLWERTGAPGEARVDWLRLRDEVDELAGLEPEIRAFAERQVARIDRRPAPTPPWRVYGAGWFPDAAWDLKRPDNTTSYYAVRPQTEFAPACVSQTGVRIPTRRWFQKLSRRYDAGYHPLQHAQSWLRLSVGTIYGVVPAVAGAGMAVGGCAAGAFAMVKGPGHGGEICGDSLAAGGQMMRQAPRVWHEVLAPDFRHWGYVPAAFIVTTAPSLGEEPCSRGLPARDLAQAPSF